MAGNVEEGGSMHKSNPEPGNRVWGLGGSEMGPAPVKVGRVVAIGGVLTGAGKSESSSNLTHSWVLSPAGEGDTTVETLEGMGHVAGGRRSSFEVIARCWEWKSGVRERRCVADIWLVKGLVLPDWMSDRKGLGDVRRISWERLREGGREEGQPGKSCREDCDVGCRVQEPGGAREAGVGLLSREQLLVRDWVLDQEVGVDGNRPRVRLSKGSGFDCASF